MAFVSPENAARERRKTSRRKRNPRNNPQTSHSSNGSGVVLGLLLLVVGAVVVYFALDVHSKYTLSLQSPLQVHLQWPVVIARRLNTEDARLAQLDQRHALSAYQEYACAKFGSACRVALAIQRAENPTGKCEMYHYNSDGTLDWGYFQINTIHLQRTGLNLRDLLDCRANIDFAYQLYSDQQGFAAWDTYKSGAYRRFLRSQ